MQTTSPNAGRAANAEPPLAGDQPRPAGPLKRAEAERTGAWSPNPPQRSLISEAAASAAPPRIGEEPLSAASPSHEILFSERIIRISCCLWQLSLDISLTLGFWHLSFPLLSFLASRLPSGPAARLFCLLPQARPRRAALPSSGQSRWALLFLAAAHFLHAQILMVLNPYFV
jgi:hypothetical protein